MVESIVSQITEWLSGSLSGDLVSFVISLFPILELRGGMIAASLLGVPLGRAFILCYIANLLPIPVILFCIRRFIDWCKNTKLLHRLAEWLEHKTEKNRDKVLKYQTWGLLIFVALPLPGTGAWTGALVAAMLDMPIKKSFPIIALGVLIAGIIMAAITYGLPALFSVA